MSSGLVAGLVCGPADAAAPNIEWQKCLSGSGDFDRAYSIQQTSGGGYIVAGWTESNDGDVSGYHSGGDMWCVKLGPDSSGGGGQPPFAVGTYVIKAPKSTIFRRFFMHFARL